MLGALADEVFAPRQQREQLEPEISNKESSECDRWNAHKRIPDYGGHAGMNGVEYDDVRQVHAIAHTRKIVYQSPQEAVAAIPMNVSEEQEESCCHDRNVQRGEVPRQLEALYLVLVTESVEKPSSGSGVTHYNHADCEPVDTRRRRHPESLDVGGQYGIANEA
jgi:hypothetical protein